MNPLHTPSFKDQCPHSGHRRAGKAAFARCTVAAVLWLSFFTPARPASAVTFNVTYDSSVTNIGTLAQVQTAFGAAVQTIQNLYTNPCTINVTVYSDYAGPFGYIGLGQSFTHFTGSSTFKYPQLTNALRAARTTLADSNAVASLPASDPLGGSTNKWWLPRAEAKALNVLISPTDTNLDGEVGFASDQTYTFDPNNRNVAGAFDFIAVAEHELTEVMGRTTFGLDSTNFTTFDLFRFTTNGVRSFDPFATNVYFSVNNGTNALNYYYSDPTTGDIQDWQAGASPDSFDAFSYDSDEGTLSAADLMAMDILGYGLNYQPPQLARSQMVNGTFQLTFTNTPGTSYTVLAGANLAASVSQWLPVGTTTEGNAGQFQFTDPQAGTNAVRFYRVRLN